MTSEDPNLHFQEFQILSTGFEFATGVCSLSPSDTKLAELMLAMQYYISLHQKNEEAMSQHSSQ